MDANSTIPFPLFNADTMAVYPAITIGLVYTAFIFFFGLIGFIDFMNRNRRALGSIDWPVLLMMLMSCIRIASLLLQYTTTYIVNAKPIGQAAFTIGTLILGLKVFEILKVFIGIFPIQWLKKKHITYYQIAYTVMHLLILVSIFITLIIPSVLASNVREFRRFRKII